MGKKTKTPAAPNYAALAKQQGIVNKETGIASAIASNPNVIGPQGSQNVTWEKDANGNMVPTIKQELAPEQTELRGLLANLAKQTAAAIPGNRDKVYGAMMDRVNTDYTAQKDQTNSDLVASGIRPGTKAYDDAMHQLDRGRNDASNQAMLAGGQEDRNSIASILSLINGSSASPFSMPGYSGTNFAPPDIYGAGQDTYQANLAKANAQNAGKGNVMSGLFGLGGSILGGPMGGMIGKGIAGLF